MNLRSLSALLSGRSSVLTAAIFVGLLFVLPLLVAARNHYEAFAFANESIAYRWGHASRIVSGDTPPILPQGFTILAIQEQLVRFIEWLLPPSAGTLRSSIQWFCWGTFWVFIGGFVTVLVNMVRSHQSTADRLLLVFLPWAAATWATGAAGMYYSLLPDYYYLNAILACAAGWRLLPFIGSLQRGNTSAPDWRQVLLLGLVLGLGVANKITWGVPCVVASFAVLLAVPGNFGRRLAYVVVLAATAALTVILVLLVHYQLSPRGLWQGLQEWLKFMQGQKGEFALGSPAFYGMMRNYNYDGLYSLAALTVLACVALVTGWRARLFALGSLAGFALLLWAAAQRPAGSTLWDINVLLLLLAASSLQAVESARRRGWLLAIWVLALGVLAIRHPPRCDASRFADTHTASSNRFEVFQEITRFAGDRPQFVMLANNEYGHGGVYELLLKAASDFPTWNVSVGRTWLKRFGADLTFLHEYGTDMKLPDDTSGACVIWFDRPDLPPLASRYEQLAALVRDPANELVSLPVFMMNHAIPPKVQIWAHAVRRKTGEPFQPIASLRLPAPAAIP